MKKEQKKEEWVSTKDYEDLDQNQNTLLLTKEIMWVTFARRTD